LAALVSNAPGLAERLRRLRRFSRTVRTSEYHVTNACNLRCDGCWFYEYGFDQQSNEVSDVEKWERFAREQARKGVTHALLIGGEPTLYLDRVEKFVQSLRFVTVSTNGLRRLPREGFERVAIAVSLFGGLLRDDALRGKSPNGSRLSGLLEESLRNYKGDERVTFIYALAPGSAHLIEDTVRRIGDNGNQVTFNYYTAHGSRRCSKESEREALLEEALRVRAMCPQVVSCDEFFIRTLISGSTEFGTFGYEVCPSISVSHPSNGRRVNTDYPVLPNFDVYAADQETINFCCTSGRCDSCRDSQAIYSWLLLNCREFLRTKQSFETWLNLAESYWGQFVWSPYHRAYRGC
jgi:pyruvate-formate lyase-activating enzyme